MGCCLLDECGVPGSRLSERDRPDRAEAMNDIPCGDQGYAQTGLLHRHALQAVDLFGTDDIEDRAHLALADECFFLFRVPRRVELVHLPDLLLQRHPREEIVNKPVFSALLRA